MIIFFIILLNGFSQDNEPAGSRSSALAGSSLCISDVWSAYNNPAGLVSQKDLEAGFYYENRFLIKELSRKVFVVAIPFYNDNFGLSYSKYGFELYSENKFGLSYAKRLGKYINAGIQLDYFSIELYEPDKNRRMLTFEAGMISELNEKIKVGVYAFNPVNATIEGRKAYNPCYKIAGLYKPISNLSFIIESSKRSSGHTLITSAEYNIVKTVFARCGVSFNPQIFAFGFGFEKYKIKFNVASNYNQILGFSTNMSLSFGIK